MQHLMDTQWLQKSICCLSEQIMQNQSITDLDRQLFLNHSYGYFPDYRPGRQRGKKNNINTQYIQIIQY